MREKSSRVLTSFSRRWLFRCATSRCWRDSAGSPSPARACSSGPSMSASGVRNSWLTFEKNVVLARSSSASASARCRSSSAARALPIRPPIWAASSSNQRRYSASNGRRALTPSTIAPTLRPRPRSASGSTIAAGGGSGHGPAGTAPIRSDRPVTSSAVPVSVTRRDRPDRVDAGAVDGRRGIAGGDPGRCDQAHAAVRLPQVDQRERDVGGARRQHVRRSHAGDVHGPRIGGGDGEVAQRPQAPFADHAGRRLGAGAEHAADAARFVGHGAVGEREVDLLAEPAALHEQHQVVGVGRVAGEGAGHERLDVAPDLRPDLAGRPAQRPRVLVAGDRPVAVVVDLDELRPPEHEHGVAGVEQDAEGGLQALRPGLRRAERRPRPVLGADQRAQLTATLQERRDVRRACGHRSPVPAPARPGPLVLPPCSRLTGPAPSWDGYSREGL